MGSAVLLRTALATAVALPPLGLAYFLWRRVSRARYFPARRALIAVIAGALAALAIVHVERWLLGWMSLSLEAQKNGALGALMAMLLLVAPLEEASKVLVVWPFYLLRDLQGGRLGLAYAVCGAGGFAAAESAFLVATQGPSAIGVLRVLAGAPAHVFFAGLWGYALGSRSRGTGRWFSLAWTAAFVLHGLYDHLVFGRGPALLVAAVPLLAVIALGSWITVKDLAPSSDSRRSFPIPLGIDPPSLSAMRRAMQRTDRPLMLHWIAFGALVTLGVIVVSLACAVYVGHRVGIDFAAVDEADVRAGGALALLGAAILLAFPLSGYLIARASSAHSVLEPALAAALAIVAVVLLLSVTEPVAVVVALAVSPLAFGLACGGAWFGIDRP